MGFSSPISFLKAVGPARDRLDDVMDAFNENTEYGNGMVGAWNRKGKG